MRLRFSDLAESDLGHIHEYIAGDSPAAARRVIAAILDCARLLEAFPEMGRAGRIEGTRELSVPRLPYFLVYTVSAETVDIEQVIHAKRKYPPSRQI